jgi:hypothetical protein
MDAHLIVKQVHDAYPKVPEKMAMLLGKTAETFRSHHREPKSRNPLQTGNTSPVTHYIEYVHRNEAAVPGAGRMMNNRVYASLNSEFDEDDGISQEDLHENLLDEACDVNKWLAKFDLEHATPNQLIVFERECDEAVDAINAAKSKARSLRRQAEAGFSIVETNGRAA